MLSDIENVRKLTELLGDEDFVDALTKAEALVNDVGETLERVEEVEDDAQQAVREANAALNAVDYRLQKFDETIRLIEAKIEAGFSVGFFFFALQQWTAGSLLLAVGLALMGLLGISSLVVTVATLPQVQRLQQLGDFLTDQIDDETHPSDVATGDAGGRRDQLPDVRIDWQTAEDRTASRTRLPGESDEDEDNREHGSGQ